MREFQTTETANAGPNDEERGRTLVAVHIFLARSSLALEGDIRVTEQEPRVVVWRKQAPTVDELMVACGVLCSNETGPCVATYSDLLQILRLGAQSRYRFAADVAAFALYSETGRGGDKFLLKDLVRDPHDWECWLKQHGIDINSQPEP